LKASGWQESAAGALGGTVPRLPVAENEVSDRDVFAALDPEWPGLEKVMGAYRANDLDGAKRELIAYFRRRTSPAWLFDYRGIAAAGSDPTRNVLPWGRSEAVHGEWIRAMVEDADLLTQRKFRGAVLFDLGERWERFPLFNMDGEDDKPLRVTANRFVRMNFLLSLAVAYQETKDRRYVETFVRLMESIAEKLLNEHPFVPDPAESAEAYTIHFSKNPFRSNMSVAQSAIHLIGVMHTDLFYDEAVPVGLSFRLFRYLWYVMLHHRSFDRNRYRHHNHHLFERGVAPAIFGIMFPEFPVFRPLLARGKEVIREHLENDFFPTGGYDEHSLSYTCSTTLSEFLLPVKLLAEMNGMEDEARLWEEKLRRTYSFYSGLVLPDGKFPDIGDNGGGSARTFLENGRQYYRSEAAQAVLDALGMRGAGREAPQTSALPPLTIHDPLAGYFCTRSGWTTDSHCMVMCNKEFTRHCSHNHVDMLSLILSVRGETLIGEPQAPVLYKYVSNGTGLDHYMRGLGSHNTVLVGGKPVTKADLRKRDGLHAQTVRTEALEEGEGYVYVRASHEAYPNARHTREVLFDRRLGWFIADTVDWTADEEREPAADHVQRWHLEHGVRVDAVGENALLLSGARARLLCVWPNDGGIAFHMWRNESVLDIDGLSRYRSAEDLPWIVDVRFPSGANRRRDQIRCIFLDVTDDVTHLPAMIDRCRELLNEPCFPKETERLRGESR
jgi:hypothetical protein